MRCRSSPSPSPARRDQKRLRVVVREPFAPRSRDAVDLVDHKLDRQVAAPISPRTVSTAAVARRSVRGQRAVDDVQDEVCDQRLLECRGEALDQLGRQAADEADRVGHEIPLALVLEGAGRRVERLEQTVLDRDLGARQTLRSVDLPTFVYRRERHRRRRGAARDSPRLPMAADAAEAPPRLRDPPVREPAVGLELRLTGPARADAAAHACRAAAARLPLGCFHMPRMRGRLYSSCASSTWSLPSAETACWAKMSRISCVRSTTRAESVLERALLRRLQLVVDEQHLGVGVPVRGLELLELALADVAPRVGGTRCWTTCATGRRPCARARAARPAPRRRPRPAAGPRGAARARFRPSPSLRAPACICGSMPCDRR